MTNIYLDIYNLISNHIFGGVVNVGSNQELITILLSSFACIFLFALPFLVVWKIISLIGRW